MIKCFFMETFIALLVTLAFLIVFSHHHHSEFVPLFCGACSVPRAPVPRAPVPQAPVPVSLSPASGPPAAISGIPGEILSASVSLRWLIMFHHHHHRHLRPRMKRCLRRSDVCVWREAVCSRRSKLWSSSSRAPSLP